MEKNKIYCGDSLELMKELDDNSIDLVITSPPYADLKKYIDFDGIHPDKYVEWFIPYCKEIERIIKPTGSFILNINDKVQNKVRHPYVFDLISELHKQTGLKMYERLFWNKLKSLPNRARFGDRVEYIFWFVKDATVTVPTIPVPVTMSPTAIVPVCPSTTKLVVLFVVPLTDTSRKSDFVNVNTTLSERLCAEDKTKVF